MMEALMYLGLYYVISAAFIVGFTWGIDYWSKKDEYDEDK